MHCEVQKELKESISPFGVRWRSAELSKSKSSGALMAGSVTRHTQCVLVMCMQTIGRDGNLHFKKVVKDGCKC